MRIKEFLYFSFFLFYQKIFLCIQKIKNVFVIFKKWVKSGFPKAIFRFFENPPTIPRLQRRGFSQHPMLSSVQTNI